MTTLILKSQGNGKWYPNSVAGLQGHLLQFFQPMSNFPQSQCVGVAKNVAYTIQHIEFLSKIDTDMRLSAVLEKQNFKSFIIHGCAVVEAIFYYALLSTGNAAQTEWLSKGKVQGQFKLEEKEYLHETEYFTRAAKPILVRMTFDTMCKRVEKKKLINLGNDFYKNLPYLRNLRNRVHIYGIENTSDTDYIKFERKDYELMKRILASLLTSTHFSPPDELDLAFLGV